MDPRISFSNDFADTQQHAMKHESIYREAPVSSDFEFSVKNYSMRSADEIIFQGVVLPAARRTTLKEELLAGDDDDDDDYGVVFGARPAGSLGWWKERLGIRKPPSTTPPPPTTAFHRKCKSGDMVLESVAEEVNHHNHHHNHNHNHNHHHNICVRDTALAKKENQESLFEGGFKCIENAM